MSTRKTLLSSLTKTDNASKTNTSPTTDLKKEVELEVFEQATKDAPTDTSTAQLSPTTSTSVVNNDTEDAVVPAVILKTPEAVGKSVRKTRHSSPMLLPSPTTSSNSSKKFSGSEELTEQSDGEDANKKTSPTAAANLRGRKLLKDIKDSKEALLDEDIPLKCLAQEARETINDADLISNSEETICALNKDDKELNKAIKLNVAESMSEKVKDLPSINAINITPTTSNRVTRKTLAQPVINSTRVTRNRRQSSNTVIFTEHKQQPATNPRGRKKKLANLEAASKRKRGDEEAEDLATSEPSTKYIKIEEKITEDEKDVDETTEAIAVELLLNIKDEPCDSDEIYANAATLLVSPTTSQIATSRGRGRAAARNKTPISSTVRETRQTKAGSPALPIETAAANKRRRVGSSTRSNLSTTKTASTSSLTAATTQATNDEDSKDSITSSTIEDMIFATTDSNQRKDAADYAETGFQNLNENEQEETDQKLIGAKNIAVTENDNAEISSTKSLTIDSSLSVLKPKISEKIMDVQLKEQNSELTISVDEPMPSTSAEKDSSLTPEIMTEEVSVMSVENFYEKREFLENNLGIEEDPKLGQIVQKVNNISGTLNGSSVDKPSTVDNIDDAVGNAQATNCNDSFTSNEEDKVSTEEQNEISTEHKLMSLTDDTFATDNEKDEIENIITENSTLKKEETEEVIVSKINAKQSSCSPHDNTQDAGEEAEESRQDDYDVIENEILEELAKAGVVDASGNPASLSKNKSGIKDTSQSENQQNNEYKQPKSISDGQSEINTAEDEENVLELNDVKMNIGEAEETDADVDLPELQTLVPVDLEKTMKSTSVAVYAIEENKENLSIPEPEKPLPELEHMDIDCNHVAIKQDLISFETSTSIDETLKHEDKNCNILNVTTIKSDDQKVDPACLLSTMDDEAIIDVVGGDDEELREKEKHLQNLGLLTHKAAEQIRQEYIQEASTRAAIVQHVQQHSVKRNGNKGNVLHAESSGTLKTVIKLNRTANSGSSSSSGITASTISTGPPATNSGRKSQGSSHGVRRQSLKITFQKGRGRCQGNSDRVSDQNSAQGEDSYYTIQNENEDSSHSETTLDNNNFPNISNLSSINKKDDKEKILIPEKASSFKFHPGRLCEDQCYYCSGKFGLYDTPCHVGQIKSIERQQKILANEEKLTVDNCLCDACFRHVDRRANVPSYKKRLSAPGHLESAITDKNNLSSGEIISENGANKDADPTNTALSGHTAHRKCLVTDCPHPAGHSLRRKCIRKSLKKFLLNFEIPTGTPYVWLCQSHYDTVIQCSGCVLCKRRLGKNHMYHITSDTDRLEKALSEMGIPVQLGIGTAVCKLCRYFANLLMKPPDSSKSQKAEFVKNYRKRLLQFHNIHDGSNEASENDEEETITEKTLTDSMTQKEADNSEPVNSTLEDSNATATDEGCDVNSGTASGMIADYDVPVNSTDSNSSSSSTSHNDEAVLPNKQMSKLKAILQQSLSGSSEIGSCSNSDNNKGKSTSEDISNVLRANPNISMRELFHGEEELGLQFKVPFGCSTSQRTPEGWTRVQTFLQYDEPTRQLWEELQKPYGNQSSFLRHLILLEKYYRNGDLILAPNASSNASVYTQTVRQRLNSYDHGHCGGLQTEKPTPIIPTDGNSSNQTAKETPEKSKLAEPIIPTVELNDDDDLENYDNTSVETVHIADECKSSKISVDKLTKQLSSNAVTIIARSKDSYNKQQQTGAEPLHKLLPIKDAPPLVPTNTGIITNSRSILKTNLLSANKSVEILPLNSQLNNANKSSSSGGGSSIPTDNKQSKILEAANKLLGNAQQDTQSSAVSGINKQMASNSQHQQIKLPTPAQLLNSPPELISLQRRRSSASTGHGTSSTNKRIQQPPKISTNRNTSAPPNIVILPDSLTPQERLQSRCWRPTLLPVSEQQHTNILNKSGALYQTADGRRLPSLVQVQSGGKPYLISIFDYNRMCILRREKLLRDQMLKETKTKQQQQQSNSKSNNSTLTISASNAQHTGKVSQTTTMTTTRPQLQQLQQKQQQQLPTSKSITQSISTNNANTTAGMRYPRLAPKPLPSLSAGGATCAASANNLQHPGLNPMLANALTNATATSAGINSTDNTSPWLWKNFPEANQFLMSGNTNISSKLPHMMPKPSTIIGCFTTSKSGGNCGTTPTSSSMLTKPHTQNYFENSIMTKIPKSLTVIPQHKLLSSLAASNMANANIGTGSTESASKE